MRQERGFTLVELVITVAIIAIVMAYAVPAYSRFVAQNKVQSFAYALAADLNNARSEAIRRGQAVEVCAASDTTVASCTGAVASNWSKSWITVASGAVIRVHQAEAGTVASTTLSSVRFGASGRSSNPGNIVFQDAAAATSASVSIAAYGSIRAGGGMGQ